MTYSLHTVIMNCHKWPSRVSSYLCPDGNHVFTSRKHYVSVAFNILPLAFITNLHLSSVQKAWRAVHHGHPFEVLMFDQTAPVPILLIPDHVFISFRFLNPAQDNSLNEHSIILIATIINSMKLLPNMLISCPFTAEIDLSGTIVTVHSSLSIGMIVPSVAFHSSCRSSLIKGLWCNTPSTCVLDSISGPI